MVLHILCLHGRHGEASCESLAFPRLLLFHFVLFDNEDLCLCNCRLLWSVLQWFAILFLRLRMNGTIHSVACSLAQSHFVRVISGIPMVFTHCFLPRSP